MWNWAASTVPMLGGGEASLTDDDPVRYIVSNRDRFLGVLPLLLLLLLEANMPPCGVPEDPNFNLRPTTDRPSYNLPWACRLGRVVEPLTGAPSLNLVTMSDERQFILISLTQRPEVGAPASFTPKWICFWFSCVSSVLVWLRIRRRNQISIHVSEPDIVSQTGDSIVRHTSFPLLFVPHFFILFFVAGACRFVRALAIYSESTKRT